MIELQVAVARVPGQELTEELVVEQDGHALPLTEIATPQHGRIHRVELPDGPWRIRYRARVEGVAEAPPVEEYDLALHRRPSRYVPSDTLGGFATAEFGASTDLLADIGSWVAGRLSYVPGSSGPSDGAAETLLSGQGVCRDYAHVVIALLRALNVPARLMAVYAPGCDPMDFHAVVEAFEGTAWQVIDATGLAPIPTMVRIATGRDAADTSFLATVSGNVSLERSSVSASASA